MIIRTSIDNQIPAWTVNAGKILIILMIAGLALMILRDLEDMRRRWTGRDCARGSNVPTPTRIPPMPKKVRIKLAKHEGVDMEEITLEREADDRTFGIRLDDDDKRQRYNRR